MRNLLIGENIKLTAIKESDYEVIDDWFNDIGFLRHYDILPAIPQTSNTVRKTIEDFINSNNSCIFAIRLLKTNQILGVIGFLDIIWSSSVATFFIGIGENSYVGRGMGREAIELLLDFGFNELNLHRIQLNVISYNHRAIRAYEKVGFIKEGSYRELVHRDGKRYDLLLYGMLKSEWNDNKNNDLEKRTERNEGNEEEQ